MEALKGKKVERGCPRCWTPMPLPALREDDAYCGDCGLHFRARVFRVAARSPALRPVDAAAVSAAHCSRHERNAAVAACDKCGAFICALCRVEHAGASICTTCFDKLGEDGGAALATTYRSFHLLAVGLAFAGLFVWPFDVVIGPAAVAAAFASRSQSRKMGEEIGATYELLPIVAGVLETLGGLAFILITYGRR